MEITMPYLDNIPKKYTVPEAQTKRNDTDPFYTSWTWRKIRKMVLIRDAYLCQHCKEKGIFHTNQKYKVIDHIKPRRLWPEFELVIENLQTLCGKCHNIKSGKEQKLKTKEDWRNMYE